MNAQRADEVNVIGPRFSPEIFPGREAGFSHTNHTSRREQLSSRMTYVTAGVHLLFAEAPHSRSVTSHPNSSLGTKYTPTRPCGPVQGANYSEFEWIVLELGLRLSEG